jgi:hypothetical protein
MSSVGGASSLNDWYGAESRDPSARQKLIASSAYVRLHEGQRFMILNQALPFRRGRRSFRLSDLLNLARQPAQDDFLNFELLTGLIDINPN